MSRDAASRSSGELVAALNEVVQALQDQPGSNQAVHTARKAIKRARAALRLLREVLGEATFNRENTALRDAGRCLAPLRDAKSLVDAYETFRKRHASQLQAEPYDVLATQLHARLDGQRQELERAGVMLQKCMDLITTSREHANQRHIEAAHAAFVPAGLQRIFHRGRKARALAKREFSPHALHEWRKQVKYLSNALKILDGSSRRLSNIIQRSDKLADRLGEDHDLAELMRYLTDPKVQIHVEERLKMASLIEDRRARLQEKAHAIGNKIYRQKPRYFVRKLARRIRTTGGTQTPGKPAAGK